MHDSVQKLYQGNVRTLARAISAAEESVPSAGRLLAEVFPNTGRARVLGITGSPGAGKSSLVDRLIKKYRALDEKVGVIAIDPSSAYSGGAILGDRIRMQEHAADRGVFIRSMATRGHLGGLARTTNDAVDLMDAAGYDPILIETVGVGQDEVDVVRAADVVVVVLVPGMGDDVQAIKAGILEIADLFVVNKSDRPGADRLIADLDFVLSLSDTDASRKPPILKTVAVRDEGVDELRETIDRLYTQGGERRLERRRDRAASRFHALLAERLSALVLDSLFPGGMDADCIDAIAERRTDPYAAVEEILKKVKVQN
jgi:LAO/AO transport system kinase